MAVGKLVGGQGFWGISILKIHGLQDGEKRLFIPEPNILS
jgi:hypothetical protein